MDVFTLYILKLQNKKAINPLFHKYSFVHITDYYDGYIDIGSKHRRIAFKRPLNFNIFYLHYRFMDTLAANFTTDHNKIYFQGKISHYLEVS